MSVNIKPEMPPTSSQIATPRDAGLRQTFQKDVTIGLINGAFWYLGWKEDVVVVTNSR